MNNTMQFDQPLITTVIPTYRRPKLLKRAIESALAQTNSRVQVCVYDNASGDETAEVVKNIIKEDARVIYHCHPTNIGPAANMSYGIERVTTPFFSLLSDDDIILPEFYKDMIGQLERFPQAMFSAGSVISMTEQGKVIDVPLSSWKREGYFVPPEGLFEMIGGRHPTITGILFRKEVVDVFKGMDSEMVASDLDLELRIAARFPFVISKKPCGIFVYHASSVGVQANTSYIWPDCLKIVRRLTEDDQIPVELRKRAEPMLDRFFQEKIFVLGLRSAIRGDFPDAYKASVVLQNHYKTHMRAVLLNRLTTIFRHIKPIHKLVSLCFNIAKSVIGVRNQQLQKEFGAFARFLRS
jgi:glycosyltransferase involved in cell wall biosynthesis